MAIFYKHIKGTANANAEGKGLWTGLKWSTESANNLAVLDAKFLPHIHIAGENIDPEESNDLGYVITSNAIGQIINSQIDIPSIKTTTITGIQETSKKLTFVAQDFRLTVDDARQNDCLQIHETSGSYTVNGPKETISNGKGTANFYQDVTAHTHIVVQSNSSDEGYVQAVYFNATSDKRAKENIHPLLTNALDIIKKVQVYTFNLKSQPEEKMIGVIAQEFLDKKLDGVSLVANEAATGKDGDYMSIRESKLVYLLLKGMQEQQEQIEQLRKRITELESK